MKNVTTHRRSLTAEDGSITLDGLAKWVGEVTAEGIDGSTQVVLDVPAGGGNPSLSVSTTAAQ